MVAFLILGMIAPLSAQNLVSTSSSPDSDLKAADLSRGNPRFADVSALPGTYEVPALEKAAGEISDEPQVFSQDSGILDGGKTSSRNVETVVDLGVLRNPSPYRKMAVGTQGQPYDVAADSLQNGLAMISAVYREAGKSEKATDCQSIALSVEQRVKLDPSKVLEIVGLEAGANPDCSCEIVKTAIKASEADANQTVAIAEAAIHASPESMRIISQCAIAAMPESIAGVQSLLARLDPNCGETGYSSKSAKSAKSAKVAAITAPPLPNPLDRPPPPILPPPPIFPPPVTRVDPCASAF
jgi:hypothetical protein